MDQIFAPVTWVAAALTALALLAGPALIGAKSGDTTPGNKTAGAGAEPQGRALFVSNCGGCHTLSRARTSGSVGPNLDRLKPDTGTVKTTVENGRGTMPSFEGRLKPAEIDAVAAFVTGVDSAPAKPVATSEPASGTATTLRTDRGPDGIAVAKGRVWVANATAGTLQRFDGAAGKAVGRSIAVGRQPDNPLVVDGAVWVALSGDDAVARVEGGKVTRIPVGKAPEDLALVGDSVWVSNAGEGTVTRIDRASGQVRGAPIRVGGRPLGIGAGGGTVWVSSADDGTVWRLDAATGARRGAPIRVGERPRAVAVGAGTAWVANSGDGTVTRVRDRRTIDVGKDPRDLVVAAGSVWVANAGDDSVTRIDAASGRPAGDPIEVGDDPIGIAVDGGSLWTTDFRDDTLTRAPAG